MRRKRRSTDKVVWHCSATPPAQDIGAGQISIMHKARGWDNIGYHAVIRRDGRLQLGEDWKLWGAHALGINATSFAICMVGGVDEDNNPENNFTEAQWATAKLVFEFVSFLYPDAEHVGHRDLSEDTDGDQRIMHWEFMKDCPCFSVKQWLDNDLEPVSDLYAQWEVTLEELPPEWLEPDYDEKEEEEDDTGEEEEPTEDS